MRVVLLVNPSAGAGRGARVVARAEDALRARGAEVERLEVARSAGSVAAIAHRAAPSFDARMDEALARADALVVAGGDGTVHHALPALLRAGVPVYHLPLGTENLFARQFGMGTDAALLARTVVERGATPPAGVDVGVIERDDQTHDAAPRSLARPFAIMLSFGPDASVVHRLAAVRRGPISHASYIGPIARELTNPCVPRLRVVVDGRVLVDGQHGLLVVANSRQYALRIDPAHDARVDDGLLTCAFFPALGGLGAAWWLLRSRLRRAGEAIRANGQCVEVSPISSDAPAQVDGEALVRDARGIVRLRVLPGALRVLDGGGRWG